MFEYTSAVLVVLCSPAFHHLGLLGTRYHGGSVDMLDEQADIAYKNLVFEESVRQWVCPSPRDEGRPRTPRDLFLDARRHSRGRGGEWTTGHRVPTFLSRAWTAPLAR